MMPIIRDIKELQTLLEKLEQSIKVDTHSSNTSVKDDIDTLLTVLKCPVFGSILTIQDSLDELKEQLLRHPSILPVDFEISPSTGELLLNLPPEPNHVIANNSDSYEPSSDPEQSYEFDCRPNVPKYNAMKASIESSYYPIDNFQHEPDYVNINVQSSQALESSTPSNVEISVNADRKSPVYEHLKQNVQLGIGSADVLSSISLIEQLPEMETFEVELVKDQQGLGITIAGYVCEREEISGIFIKSIAQGSVADLSKQICINDQIIEVDGRSLCGYTNHEAVEVLRNTGKLVKLRLARYLHGSKYEQLQLAISNPDIPLPSNQTTPGATVIKISDQHTDSNINISLSGSSHEMFIENDSLQLNGDSYDYHLNKWRNLMGQNYDIIVANIIKFQEGGGLGISLEGTVDVENGREVRPHHYIRSILDDGPVGVNGNLRSGDELLEVNGKQLLGLSHADVVPLLKDLPMEVQMICARPKFSNEYVNRDNLVNLDAIYKSSTDRTNIDLAYGSLNSLVPSIDRLVKAKSDGSLAITTLPSSLTSDLSKVRSRSLEPLTGLAMWSSEPQIIELIKGDRGLGFSILDYQDPMNASETVIVIRSLVPGGVAQQDGRLIPGDRLLFVNDTALENATLDMAVQALKGAPKGKIIVGVAKPLPFPENNNHCAPIHSQPISIDDLKSSIGIIDDAQTGQRANMLDISINKNDHMLPIQQNIDTKCSKSQVSRQESLCSVGSQSSSSAASIADQFLSSVPIERYNMPATTSPSGSNIVYSESRSSTPLDFSPTRSPSPSCQPTPLPLPVALERTIKIKKGNDPLENIQKKYGDLNGYTFLVDLHKGLAGLGISLAGNRDRTKMSVFVCGMHPKGSAFKDGRIQIGDEILEVNGIVLHGRCHLNASAIIKSLIGPVYEIIVLRREGALDEMAVKPLTQFPVHLEEDSIEEKYFKYKGVRTINVRKSSHGLGIMIIEGKHSELGRGVFVSDIQEGSPAEMVGLSVGDMILCVNQIDLIGADYDTAASTLKGADGLLTLIVAKPSKTSVHDIIEDQSNLIDSSNKTTKETS